MSILWGRHYYTHPQPGGGSPSPRPLGWGSSFQAPVGLKWPIPSNLFILMALPFHDVSLIDCCWEYKFVQPLWRAICQCLQQFYLCIPFDFTVSLRQWNTQMTYGVLRKCYSKWISLFSISLPTLFICSLFDNSHSDSGKLYLIVVWFAFPWWLMMLSIFSCVCWPSLCLLWKNVYPDLHILKSACLVFCYWVVWVLHIFCILTFTNIYSHSVGCLFV